MRAASPARDELPHGVSRLTVWRVLAQMRFGDREPHRESLGRADLVTARNLPSANAVDLRRPDERHDLLFPGLNA